MLSFFFPALRPPKHEANSGSAATSDEQLHIGLERLCRLPRYQPGRSVLSVPDDQVKQVVRVLQILDTKNGRAEWAKWSARPRTYIILRNVGGIDLMSQFVHGGYTDFELPYENRTLPGFIEDNVMRKEFLQVQVHLLTSAKELESLSHQSSPTGVLPHINFDGPGEQHFLRISNLGQGGFGCLFQVYSVISSF